MSDLDNVIEVSEQSFDTDVLERSHEMPVVVDFWAPWCGPCRMLGPILEKLAADPDFDFVLAKVNVDNNPGLSMRYQVQGIPAVKAFLNGEVAGEFVGALPEPKVRQFLRKLLPSEVDMALGEARSLLATRHWDRAEDAFRDILEGFPNHQAAEFGLAQALLAQGIGCEAIDHLERVTDGPELLQARTLMPLATYLCQLAGTERDLEAVPAIERQYRRAAWLLERGKLEAAMDGLLDVLREDKRYRDGEVKDVLLGIFVLLGDHDPLTIAYRQELASVLF